VITPRRTRLVRVPDLHAFRAVLGALSDVANRQPPTTSPLVVVPTRSAARQLGGGVTRDELYEEFRRRLADPPRRLSAIERDVLAQASARAAADAGAPLAFQLRPGLVAEMLRFYDQLKRQTQTIDRFEALITEALGSDELDRGAARLRQQTRFLADTFRDYERRAAESGACDEHRLRARLLVESPADPIRGVVVTVADWIADDNGLHVADFDLLARVPGLESIEVVATESILRSGFHERIHSWLPGIEETDLAGFGIRDSGFAKPVLMVPPSNPESRTPNPDMFYTHRDREEELIAVARTIRANERRGEAAPLERTAVVFKQPLPYLYLAPRVFAGAGLPIQMADTLPLAAEPTAAAFDLVLDAAASDVNRESIVALLRSPHFAFGVERAAVNVLDRSLSEARYLGGAGRAGEAGGAGGAGAAGSAALQGCPQALAIAEALALLVDPRTASEQLRTLLAFWNAHAASIAADDLFAARERRARAAIVDALAELAAIHAEQDDPVWTVADLSVAVRRLIEEQTFVADAARHGVHVLDDRAARYGDFDDLTIVGVVEHEWPSKPRRNIFYPPALLKALGWPTEKDRRAAADAQFLDLVASSSRRTTVSTFTLEDDALVTRSMQLDELPRARLSTVPAEPADGNPVFVDERLSLGVDIRGDLAPTASAWAVLRGAARAADEPAFHGAVGAQPGRVWSVSALETYLGCPFKFFAQHVLALEEEPDDEEVMDPRRQGLLVHQVFEDFFREWQAGGRETITDANLDEARALFQQVVDRSLAPFSDAEAALERTRLLGSPAAAGLGEAVFRMEAERPIRVVERLLEHRLEGEFTIAAGDESRRVALRGKADRIDLLEDGTFRLIDYKLGWPPDRTRALQLPIYSLCAEQRLLSYRGRAWTLGDAAYLAFKGPRRVVPLFTAASRQKVLADAQERLTATLDAIARGEFPPTPDDVYRCETCSFAGVCRKDYVGDV
jgi:RecB family exonuclease/inactivated superfamily I helicase